MGGEVCLTWVACLVVVGDGNFSSCCYNMILSDWLGPDPCHIGVGGADVSRRRSASWSARLSLAGCYTLGVLYVVQDEFFCRFCLWWVIWGWGCRRGDLLGLCGWDVWDW